MSRIRGTFDRLRAQGRKAVIPYVVAGDPAADITVDLMCALVDAGADIIELGVPFSDPMSEGPVIQRGHERALERGVRLRTVLETMHEFRTRDAETPVLLMGYANPVEHMGYAAFADRASAAGVDALLTVDIPPEEVSAVNRELRRVGMDNIFLVAPTTPAGRIDRIAAEASGFIYYVSFKGITGADRLGFGIKDGPSAAAVARNADGVVVGSALVQRIADLAADGTGRDAILAAARDLVSDIRSHVDALEQDAA